eukprot:1805947-Pyramimonas_sp.AAC.1
MRTLTALWTWRHPVCNWTLWWVCRLWASLQHYYVWLRPPGGGLSSARRLSLLSCCAALPPKRCL